jgi:hypothetical protein
MFPLPGGEGQGEGERENKSRVSELMTTLTLIFALPLLAAIALVFVPRNFAVIMRGVALGVTFVTNNTRHFGRVAGLKTENWA